MACRVLPMKHTTDRKYCIAADGKSAIGTAGVLSTRASVLRGPREHTMEHTLRSLDVARAAAAGNRYRWT